MGVLPIKGDLTSISSSDRPPWINLFLNFSPWKSNTEAKAIMLLTRLLLGHRDSATASSLASSLLSHYGSVTRLFAADQDDLASSHGLSKEDIEALTDARIALIEDFCTPTSLDMDRKSLTARIRLAIGVEPDEQLLAIYFDAKGKSFGGEIIGKGCENRVAISPRTCVLAAARRCARGLVIAHNHPGGYANPSEDDYVTTKLVQRGASAMGITLLDHIIVSEHSSFSFSEHGLL